MQPRRYKSTYTSTGQVHAGGAVLPTPMYMGHLHRVQQIANPPFKPCTYLLRLEVGGIARETVKQALRGCRRTVLPTGVLDHVICTICEER